MESMVGSACAEEAESRAACAGYGLSHFASLTPDAVAIVDPTGEQLTYGELAQMVTRLSAGFLYTGLRSGQALAIVSPNCAAYVAVVLAGIEAGLYVVPINWHLASSEMRYILEDAETRLVVASNRLSARALAATDDYAESANAVVLSIGHIDGRPNLETFGSDTPLGPRPANGRIMAYTSATTGRPKGVHLPQSNARYASERTIEWYRSIGIELADGNVHLCASMLYHAAPLQAAIVAILMGHKLVLCDHWQPEALLGFIQSHQVTTAFMVPAMFVRLLKLPSEVRNAYSTASLRFVAHAGAPCPIDVKRQMLDWWGPIIWESYGATEAQGTIVSSEEWLKYPGTVGRPFPGSTFKILDEIGEELPRGEVGSIYFTPYTGDRFAYRGDPDATVASYRGDLITVGDVGYMNDEGYVYICDRRTDVIISSGMNIYPAEIEAILVLHPSVVDCGVFGVAHELVGAVPYAAVQLRPGLTGEPRLALDILRFLHRHLSAMKVPKRVVFTEEIPRDPNGKLYRRLLRETFSKCSRIAAERTGSATPP